MEEKIESREIKEESTKGRFIMVLVLYLLGLFMGALDTGIVTPARTVIQSDLGVDAATGIWMITIYTLFYAASIPIMGKLADMYGRKYIYIVSISLFGLGSLFCGLSSSFNSFTLLVIARAVQAVGGGGIMPIATAEFGTSFPAEKRGMALGMVGGVYGIANVFGASVGSLIMDIFGTQNWSYIFYLNVPITVFIVIAGLAFLKNNREEDSGKLDLPGIMIVTCMIFSLMYGLKMLDFFDFTSSIREPKVYIFLLIFAVLLPVFILIERRAANPVINLSYFTDRNIAIALILSILSGFVLMGVIFVPQLSENALRMATGSGGYLVIFLGIFTGVAAPVSGKFVDKFGAKIVLGFGFLITGVGALFLVFITCPHPSMFTVLTGLGITGLGLGFTMGTPLNYIMLANTDPKDSNSALATLSLVRSLGTAVAPAIMVGFIAHAGMAVSDNIMEVLPQEVQIGKLPYYEEIQDEFERLKSDPDMAAKMDDIGDMELPDMGTVNFGDMKNSDSNIEISDDMLELLQNSDVTTIVANMKTFSAEMFDQIAPDLLQKIDSGLTQGMDGVETGRSEITAAIAKMQSGYDGIGDGISGIRQGISQINTAQTQMKNTRTSLESFASDTLPGGMSAASLIPQSVKNDMPQTTLDALSKITSRSQLASQITAMEQAYDAIPDHETPEARVLSTAIDQMKATQSTLNTLAAGRIPQSMSLLDMMPSSAKSNLSADTKKKIAQIHSVSDIDKSITDMDQAKKEMNASIKTMESSRVEMKTAMVKMSVTASELADLHDKLGALRDAVPGAFEEGKQNYLISIDERKDTIEAVFQNTLNKGFEDIYLLVAVSSAVAILLLLGYSGRKEKQRMDSQS